MLSRLVIRNYRVFRDFKLDFNPEMNILVGDNASGKSTVLEAISLAMTGRIHGRQLAQELSPYLFNQNAVDEYIEALRGGREVPPPEIIIDLFFAKSDRPEVNRLRGTNNLLQTDDAGVRVRVSLNRDFQREYEEFIQDPEHVRLVPTEYYDVEWLDFAANRITALSLPGTSVLIDSSNIHLHSGVDYYLERIISSHLKPEERVRLTRAYRRLREEFSSDPAIETINEQLRSAPSEVSDHKLTLGIDVSQKARWENGIVPHLDDLPYQYVGKGEQSTLKILLSLNRRVEETHVVLVEEPENHLSFSNLGKLVKKISDKCVDKQVFITTHSSFVLNKLGLERLMLLDAKGGVRLDDLPPDTRDYFRKLSGYDTLRLVLARKAILVEGPSDELVVQRAYRDAHEGRMPIDDGIDVIDVGGLSFRRFLDIATRLDSAKVTVVTDNDGKDAARVHERYASYTASGDIKICVSDDTSCRTLEPQLIKSNGAERMKAILGLSAQMSEEELAKHMKAHKTSCALAIFSTEQAVTMPGYIADAVA
ncbi:ATP-dependent nuclease [Actinomadura sp. 6N118]|uniref:ATP-dependent nuclease n=1 Tax=Actinomadura sp. 6N118 TaxID=3375151 RepID=UPI0037B66303